MIQRKIIIFISCLPLADFESLLIILQADRCEHPLKFLFFWLIIFFFFFEGIIYFKRGQYTVIPILSLRKILSEVFLQKIESFLIVHLVKITELIIKLTIL